MLVKLFYSSCLAFACISNAYAQAAQPDPLSVESFFKPSAIEEIDLSPNGRWLAIRETNAEGRIQLKIVDLEGKEKPVIVASFHRANVGSTTWVNDEWIIFGTDTEFVNDGREYNSGLMAVKRDGSKTRQLIKKRFEDEYAVGGARGLEPTHFFSALGAPGTNEIIVEERHFDLDYKDVTHTTPRILDIATGQSRLMFKDGVVAPPEKASAWLFDQKGTARVAYAVDGPKTRVYWNDMSKGQWRKLAEFESLRWEYTAQYVDDKDGLVVSALNPDTGIAEVRQLDLTTGKPMGKPIAAFPGFDVGAAPVKDRGSNQVHGIHLLTKQYSTEWYSPAMQQVQERVDAMLPGRINYLSCRPCAAPQTVLVLSYSDTVPGDYLIYDVPSGELQRLGSKRPGHRPELMANKEFHRTKARDGRDLPVWVTRSRNATGPRPAIVLAHGGPSSNGEWAYDPEVQFLASRGYVVIEPEFRGSTGYGDEHHRAGWRKWGTAIQDDIADSLKFGIDKGWVDPKKVCIAGASFGGYSALMGLAKHSSLYKCAVAWVAVTDPRLLYTVHWSDITSNGRRYHLPETMGDLVKDAEMLKASAPIELAPMIKAPILLAYGGKDHRVPLVHGQKMRAALARNGNEPEWIEYSNEGHGWDRTVNRIDFWRRVDAFLARHLK